MNKLKLSPRLKFELEGMMPKYQDELAKLLNFASAMGDYGDPHGILAVLSPTSGRVLKCDKEAQLAKCQEAKLDNKQIEELADLLEEPRAVRLLAEWLAIDHNETRLQFEKYMAVAQELYEYITIIIKLTAGKHRDRPELREKIATEAGLSFQRELERQSKIPMTGATWQLAQDIEGIDPKAWEAICYAVADSLEALYPDEEEIRKQIEVLRGEITALNKKLDDREADLIEAKREELERILAWIVDECDEIHDPTSNDLIYYAVKPGEIESLKSKEKVK